MFPLQDEDALEYMSGGAGYVLSREAVRRLQDTNVKECHVPGLTSYEDVNMGACMKALGVTAGDTRDSLGRPRFLPYPPWVLLDPSLQYQSKYSWLQRLSKYQFNFGAEYLSDQAVSFHEVREPLHYYLLQYLINEVRLSPAAWPSLQTSFPSHHDQPIPLRTHHP
ncbi:glycoprotein-N-acetylgalactosamine 3-beta-galactosyltransferase 1-like isoform X2 [Homarus americanus]|uniref:glycoprotein-N-acetylgalactosamine 3-beta-galactosyltransferase 1-like isoform X2 n=1 Tax=Homarus americanus TaxID=6706 RepID=UPI001C43FCF3|nr:glycoprotein-N-acetylgalactosamine 3-beta-galactosyltransferase 1-like isoform X2 [Homarus americanus]